MQLLTQPPEEDVVAICREEEDVAEEDTADATLHMDVELHPEHAAVQR
jgi:hypothetical protein